MSKAHLGDAHRSLNFFTALNIFSVLFRVGIVDKEYKDVLNLIRYLFLFVLAVATILGTYSYLGIAYFVKSFFKYLYHHKFDF